MLLFALLMKAHNLSIIFLRHEHKNNFWRPRRVFEAIAEPLLARMDVGEVSRSPVEGKSIWWSRKLGDGPQSLHGVY
jgi:hypothetical protein